MDSSSTTAVEDNHVIKQNVKIHSGDTPNISGILPKDEKTNTDEAALEICGKGAENNHQSRENGILHPSAETHCANILEEDSAFKEALAVGLDQSSVDSSVRAAQSSSPVWSRKRNASHQYRAKSNVVVQKCVAEGLPKGWTKEIKVTKKNGNVKKDPYYTDPMSGFIFRWMKDVLRYLKTGDIGRLAFKRKGKK